MVAIETLNEPLATSISGGPDTVVQFDKDAYGDIRVISDTEVMLHDAFQPGIFWNDILSGSDASNIVIDHHEYQVFTNELIDLSPEVSSYQTHSEALLTDAGTCRLCLLKR